MRALHVAFAIMLETAVSLACSIYDPVISFSSVSTPPKRERSRAAVAAAKRKASELIPIRRASHEAKGIRVSLAAGRWRHRLILA
jgi:hypothetical protein